MKRVGVLFVWMLIATLQASQLEKDHELFCRQDSDCPWNNETFETDNFLVDAAIRGDSVLSDRLLLAGHKPNQKAIVRSESSRIKALDLANEYDSVITESEWIPLQSLHVGVIYLLMHSGGDPKTKVNGQTVFAWHVKKFFKRRNKINLKHENGEKKHLQKEQEIHRVIINLLSKRMQEKEIDIELETLLPGHIDELKDELYPKSWWQKVTSCGIL
jgi:hypothetical protein